jgi:hypothetical protein
MRAGPLSNPEVIKLLNAHFVPVYAVNEDYRGNGPQPKAEREEFTRIYREALDAKMSAGTVHVYITSPDGKAVDSMHVAEAAKTEKLLATLKRNIARFDLEPGKTLVKPKPQSIAPPGIADDAAVFHLVSRALGGGGSWGGVVENWIVFNRAEWSKFLPSETAALNSEWEIDPKVSAKLLTHFYPSTENNDVTKNVFEGQRLGAKLISVDAEKSTAIVKVVGSLKMKHTFYHKADNNVAEAEVLGFVKVDRAAGKLLEFNLTTTEASYAGGKFGIAVQLAR